MIYPDMDMVLVTNAGNKELFQDCIMLNIIRKYFPAIIIRLRFCLQIHSPMVF